MKFNRIMFLLASSVVLLSAMVLAQESCKENSDCVEGQYCHNGDVCLDCIICSEKQRHNSEKSCPTNGFECGDCIEGFHAEPLSQGGVSEKCRQLNSNKNETLKGSTDNNNKYNDDSSDMNDQWTWDIVVVALIACASVVLFILVVSLVLCSQKLGKKGPYQKVEIDAAATNDIEAGNPSSLASAPPLEQSVMPDNPPPYSPPVHSGNVTNPARYSQGPVETNLFVLAQEKEKLAQATPFNEGSYRQQTAQQYVTIADINDVSDDDHDGPSESHFFIPNDAETNQGSPTRSASPTGSTNSTATQPSNWTHKVNVLASSHLPAVQEVESEDETDAISIHESESGSLSLEVQIDFAVEHEEITTDAESGIIDNEARLDEEANFGRRDSSNGSPNRLSTSPSDSACFIDGSSDNVTETSPLTLNIGLHRSRSWSEVTGDQTELSERRKRPRLEQVNYDPVGPTFFSS